MNILNILKIVAPVAKLLPFMRPESKPLEAGEIYYLWESLTGGYRIILLMETYMMNTEDVELHLLLSNTASSIYNARIKPIEKVLKDQGFSLPPQPGTKRYQGKPGIGQEVKLSDDEIIRSIITWAQFGLNLTGRAIGVCTNENIRKVFTDLLYDDMKSYSLFLDMGKERQVLFIPPKATARKNGLNMDEISRLWEELGARNLTVINLETYIMNTKDKELIKIMETLVNQIALPQLESLENLLKTEGFTVPPRPLRRLKQGNPGELTKILLNDSEIIGQLTIGGQVAIIHHLRSYCVAMRTDIRKLFSDFISTEIEQYQKIMTLANNRHALVNPPVVTSHKG